MQTCFSTNDVHPRDRLTYIKDVACKTYVELEFQTHKQTNYSSTIKAAEISNLGLSEVKTDQCEVKRTKGNIKGSKSDDILLSIQLQGTTTLRQDDKKADLTPGKFALYDTERKYHLSLSDNNKQLVLKIPRNELAKRLGDISLFTGLTLSSQNPMSKCALAYILTLPSITNSLDQQTSTIIFNQTLDLLSDALNHESQVKCKTLSSSKFATLMRLKSVIECHLTNPNFKPAEAALQAGISVRYANELLSSEETSLEKYIFSKRLERSGKNLSDPNLKSRTISEIAYLNGFASPSHFTRRFKEKFKTTPKEFRNKNQ